MNIDFKALDFDDVFEYMKWLLIAALVFFILFLGYKIGRSESNDEIAGLQKTVGLQIMQITQLNTTISEVNAQTKTALKNAKLAETNAKAAGKAAQDAQDRASAEQKRFAEQLRKAKKTPACEALLAQDVRKICAL